MTDPWPHNNNIQSSNNSGKTSGAFHPRANQNGEHRKSHTWKSDEVFLLTGSV